VAMVLHGVHATAGRHLVYQHDDEVCWTHAIWCHRGGGGGGTGDDEAVDAVGRHRGERHQAPVHACSTPICGLPHILLPNVGSCNRVFLVFDSQRDLKF
jgi:hypothetical protein